MASDARYPVYHIFMFLVAVDGAAAPKGSMTYDSIQGNFLRVSESESVSLQAYLRPTGAYLRPTGAHLRPFGALLRPPGTTSQPRGPTSDPPGPTSDPSEKIALCGIIGHRPLWGRCPIDFYC